LDSEAGAVIIIIIVTGRFQMAMPMRIVKEVMEHSINKKFVDLDRIGRPNWREGYAHPT
jgi:hypothetical protein